MPLVQMLDHRAVLKEMKEFQLSLLDKGTTYAKVMIGLGFGGFFTAWSGTRAHLGPRSLLWSALLVSFALVLYASFEVFQTMVVSNLAVRFAQIDFEADDHVAVFAQYREAHNNWLRRVHTAWKWIYPATVIPGLAGSFVLIGAFIRALVRL